MELHEISEQLGAEGHQLIYDICEVAKYRLPGSEGERKGQEFLQKKMKEYGADEIEIVNFYTRAKFFKWWPRLSLFFFILSLIVFHYSPLITILLIVLMLVNVGLKLFSYSFLDVLFRKHASSNVIGKLKAKNMGESGNPKRIIIIGGHTDSTYEFPLGRKYGMNMIYFYLFVLICAFIWLLIAIIIFIINCFNGIPIININPTITFEWYYVLILILTPIIIWIVWNIVSFRPVPGANDNLSGIAVATAVLKYFASNRLENVELWAVAFGSEEGGMAGSKALSKILKEQMNNGTFPADSLWVLNYDSIASDGPLTIATAEPMYRVKSHDPIVYNQLAKSAKKVGVDYILKKIDAGTDSAPFSRLGIPSVGIICGGADGIPQNWHTREDTPENCDVKGIIHSIQSAIQFILDINESLF